MRVAVIVSRELNIDISGFIPEGTTEIITGGAQGIDTLAERWADENKIPKLIIRPESGCAAPQRCSRLIIEMAEYVVAIWDGKSRGTKSAIEYATKIGKPLHVYPIDLP